MLFQFGGAETRYLFIHMLLLHHGLNAALGGHCLSSTSCSFTPTIRKKKSPLYRVAGVPGKPSNYGSECQWDTGGVLTASAKMCVRGAGKEGK